jgi:hypothetical protein
MRVLQHVTLLAVLWLSGPLAPAHADESWVAVIHEQATAYGVSGEQLVAVARCESRLNAQAVGDRGQSIGLFQLHERGLRPVFFQWGYDDPWSGWQQAAFAARAFAAGLARHWTCSRGR